jgi:hypothetical protein
MSSFSAPTDTAPPPARAAGVAFRLARPADDRALAAFVRSQAMAGRIRLAVATDPSFFAATGLLGDAVEVLVAEHLPAGDVAAIGVRARRRAWIGGRPQTVAHLSLLRVAPAVRRRDVLRRGYAFLAELDAAAPAAVTHTAILKDNLPARRVLEAGHRGMPAYEPVGDVCTFTFDTRPRRGWRRFAGGPRAALATTAADRRAAAAFTADHFRTVDGGPVLVPEWQAGDQPAAHAAALAFVEQQGRVAAAAALWDQRHARQVMVAGYAPLLALLRPVINVGRRLTGRSSLPAAGRPLNLAYLSRVAVPGDNADMLPPLVDVLRRHAAARGIAFVALSLPAVHPCRAALAAAGSHITESVLYRVSWPGRPCSPLRGMPYVEAGLL